MMEVLQLECCGIAEIPDIYRYKSGVEDILKDLALERFDEYGEHNCRFYIYSAVTRARSQDNNVVTRKGHELTAYIEQHKLGEVITMRAGKNPNTGNTVKIWVWRVNDTAFKAWAQLHNCMPKKEREDDWSRQPLRGFIPW